MSALPHWKQTFGPFVQNNHIFPSAAGVVRGLHYQAHPFAEAKRVRVVRGCIFDVVVDIRRASPTFGEWIKTEISADARNQGFVPVGFVHGLCTVEPDTEVTYEVTNSYSAEHDYGVRWNDPDLGMPWPVSDDRSVLFEKDRRQSV
jgi:dTDP-4-dehydrorhamnose 3,5-epimerase